MKRPPGVTFIAVMLLLLAAYCLGVAIFLIVGQPLLSKDQILSSPSDTILNGPYPGLAFAIVWGSIGLGLLRMREWARQTAILATVIGVGWLVPRLFFARTFFDWPILETLLGIGVRLTIVWYLFRAPIAERFSKPRPSR